MVPMLQKVELKSATTTSGVQFVMIVGELLMPVWLVGRLDFLLQVQLRFNFVSNSSACYSLMMHVVIVQELLLLVVQALVRALVPSSWTMWHALEQSQDSGTVPIMELVCTTVVTLRMLV